MANTSARTLRLLSLLQSHRFWPGPELASRLEVSPRTLRRDVDRLRELGYPVEARRGFEGGYQLSAGTTMPPLVLGDDEAVALVVGLHTATLSSVAGVAESSLRVLANVVEFLPRPLRRQADALIAATVPATWREQGQGPSVDPDVLTSVAQACRDVVRLSFAYTDRADAATERYVEPYRVVLLGRQWYLLAFDLDRTDWRTFRLDRLAEPSPSKGRFAPRAIPGGDAGVFVRDRIEAGRPTTMIEAIVHVPADAVPERARRWATVEPIDDASARLRFEADSLDWPLAALASLDLPVTVVGPAALVDKVGRLRT